MPPLLVLWLAGLANLATQSASVSAIMAEITRLRPDQAGFVAQVQSPASAALNAGH